MAQLLRAEVGRALGVGWGEAFNKSVIASGIIRKCDGKIPYLDIMSIWLD